MKKILILLTPLMIVLLILGCSKDHDAPTYSLYNSAKSPEEVEATYNTTQDKIDITWSMEDTSGVIDFMYAVSDSNVFDLGKVRVFSANLDDVEPPYSVSYDVATYNAADGDSLILYFTVSAVYNNAIFSNFIGPRAVVDSALVLR